MSKFIFLFIFLLVPFYASAVTWEVVGACDEKPLFHGSLNVDIHQSVGAISIEIFDARAIPYVGAEQGMNSIAGSATGLDAMEVLSNTSMRAYGWCFSVNGVVPSEMSDRAFLKSQTDVLVWFYAYSTLVKDQWIDFCQSGYKIKAKQFCH